MVFSEITQKSRILVVRSVNFYSLQFITMTSFYRTSSFLGLFAVVALFVITFYTVPTHAQQSRQNIVDTPCFCHISPAITRVPTNSGTDFMLCFEENIDKNDSSNAPYLEVYVAALADTATVTITSRRYPNLDTSFFLQANSSVSYTISNASVNVGGIMEQMKSLWIESDEVADDAVVEVQATSPVVCYGMDYKDLSADAFCAIPAEYAGTDYVVMSYPTSSDVLNVIPTSSEFAVAAFQNNTHVTITPSVTTLANNPAGVPFTISLDAGQCVQVQTNPNVTGLDLTASRVSADHPVTVYGGHVRTEVPIGISQTASRDMLLEVMPPTSDWGTAFVLDAFALDKKGTIGPNGDIMRAVALNDNTSITVNGNPWIILNRNQFRDTNITGPTLVNSSGPLMVGEIEHSKYDSIAYGDPSLSIIPPMNQSYNNYTFIVPEDGNFNDAFVTVATDTRSQGNIILDGQPLSSGSFTSVPSSVNGQTFAVLEHYFNQTTGGFHTISTTNTPDQAFTILAYGVGDQVSYGYTAGSLLVPHRAIQIEYPPAIAGKKHSNTVDFHTTAYQPAYVDSARFIPDNPADAVFGIHPQENVGIDIGRIDIGGSGQIHLVSDRPLTDPIHGTIKICSHLPSYFVIEPAEMGFTVYPTSALAGVTENGNIDIGATALPNPFSSYTDLNFSMPENGDVTITLYDALGRVVQHVASSEFPAGPYSVRLERRELPDGVYVCEIVSNKLNIHARVKIVAGD